MVSTDLFGKVFLRCALFLTAISPSVCSPGAKGSTASGLGSPSIPSMRALSLYERLNQRHVVSLDIIEEEEEDEYGQDTMDPNSQQRASHVVVCENMEEDVFAMTTDIFFQYSIETNTPNADVPSETMEDILPTLVDGASVDAIAEQLCSGEVVTEADTSNDGRALASGVGSHHRRLNDCYVSVSSGPRDQRIDSCQTTPDAGSQSCDHYQGSIQIVHSSACTSQKVRTEAVAALSTGVESEEFLGSVNSGDLPEGMTVTKVSLDRDNVVIGGIQGSEVTEKTGFNPGGKTIVAFAALLAAVFFLLFFVWRRRVARKRELIDDDLKSIRTDWSGPTEDGSMVKPDFRDLALAHSNQDVHRCSSALCKVCRPSLAELHIMPVSRISSNQLCPEAYEEQPGESPKRRGLWGKGRQEDREELQDASLEEPDRVSFVRVANPRKVTDWNNYKNNTKGKIKEVTL